MNMTERAIKFLEECQDDNVELQEKGYDEELIKVIELLKRGKKFEKMWGEIQRKMCGHSALYLTYKDVIREEDLLSYMQKLEQKYFPKPVKKTITIEIEGDDENMSKFTDRLNRIIGQINYGVRTNIKEGD